MRKINEWGEILQAEDKFLQLEADINSGKITDYMQINPEAFSWHGWDMISSERLFKMTLPFLKQQIKRAQNEMPDLYAHDLSKVSADEINSIEDWYRVPVLIKDDSPEYNLKGFRKLVNEQPHHMRPSSLTKSWIPFGSGGSMGKYTPTFVSMDDREREIQGWMRGHNYHGLTPEDIVLYNYNTTHKGGQWMQESLIRHGCNILLRRPEEGPARVLENMKDYNANVLFTVQQPYGTFQNQAKAVGINLHTLIMESLENPDYKGILLPDDNGEAQIKFVFLGGFEIVPYAIELMEEFLPDTPYATLLGSSEAIPQAASTNQLLTPGCECHVNSLHAMQGPHYMEIVKQDGDRWIPVEKGEEGLLVYTSWARDGTIWIRYAPGDVGTLSLHEGECSCGLYSPVISNVYRKNEEERMALLVNGCAAG